MLKKTIFCLFLIWVVSLSGQEKYIQFREIVTDSAQILTEEQLTRLRVKLTEFEKATTNQLVVLTIEKLPAETIEQYANGTFNQNKLGQKDKDNGILIVFSEADREVRIEVGYGLESYITDAVASRIIRNTMIPEFKEGRYYVGLNLATDLIMKLLNDPEALEEFKQEMEGENQGLSGGLKIFVLLFLSVFIAAGGFIFYKTYSNIVEVFRGIFIGKLGVLPGLLMAVFALLPILFSSVFIVMPLVFAILFLDVGIDLSQYEYLLDEPSWLLYALAGFIALTIILALLKISIKGKEDFKLSWFKSDKKYVSKTFSSGGTHSFGSSSGSSFSSSSSSFSGGGGSSGGGGASGSW
ncbi:TPM domain-containing protein [Flagellimonas allohymeniacidonis]|uniref:TPM domain-containing protein n=1 Tax=Flagellimonas allohymeniacidonis TaxID=2517819 RepID=A0A4Q8QFI1_9FLAO|nr:TPM domain-containing protein [Allomuricauda hymeniacidonis]TAI47968.1 TPM domain-containing protein [Allomuricauda hymeniacidonis]